MILYRARTLANRPRRQPAFTDNLPSTRVQGRWFTSDLAAARRYLAALAGEAEIVSVELADDVAESFRVATTPHTKCGLSPIDFSQEPETDHVVPMFFIMDARTVERVSATSRRDGRARDYIDVNEGHGGIARADIVRRVAVDHDLPLVDLPLAA